MEDCRGCNSSSSAENPKNAQIGIYNFYHVHVHAEYSRQQNKFLFWNTERTFHFTKWKMNGRQMEREENDPLLFCDPFCS